MSGRTGVQAALGDCPDTTRPTGGHSWAAGQCLAWVPQLTHGGQASHGRRRHSLISQKGAWASMKPGDDKTVVAGYCEYQENFKHRKEEESEVVEP